MDIKPNHPTVSVIIPIYRNEVFILELYERLISTLNCITEKFEIILVNDCSPDHSWDIIKTIASHDQRVIGINFARNFGQHYAITAGLDQSRYDWVVVMDGDLQDKPEQIKPMLSKALEGYDIVQGRRVNRQDSFLKKLSSKLFYQLFSYLTETKQDSSIANFGVYHRKVIEVVVSMRESLRFFPVMIKWVGFRSTMIDIDHGVRESGKSGYSFRKLIHLSMNTIISFSDKPLRLTVKVGFGISLCAFIYTSYIVIKAFLGDTSIQGWSSLIASVWLLGGFIISILGVLGLYISRIFDEAKKRPIYIIKETTKTLK
ncbi:glycosyltransferase family 2 protein [Paenibacillus wenxiniae]|uniref:Glycosyltransferase family 2 protein n=1 Tax=Paenibacillus wenxiniae TaxID=1636843 RepID=A0ABW4RHQ1_9BACL